MPRKLAKLSKIPHPKEYLESDFYDDPGTIKDNNKLYKDRHSIERKGADAERYYFAVYPKDVQMIFGFSADLALQFIFEIKEAVAVRKFDCLLLKDFCKYTGIDEQTVKNFIEES